MIEAGTIKSVEGHHVIVKLEVHGGCANCGMNQFCHSTGSGDREIRVLTGGIECRPGDIVEIETPARGLVSAAFLIFILPLLLAFGTYAIVYSQTNDTGWGVVGFLSCFVLSMGLVARANKLIRKALPVQPKIVRIL